jgi:hypothetical protein
MICPIMETMPSWDCFAKWVGLNKTTGTIPEMEQLFGSCAGTDEEDEEIDKVLSGLREDGAA